MNKIFLKYASYTKVKILIFSFSMLFSIGMPVNADTGNTTESSSPSVNVSAGVNYKNGIIDNSEIDSIAGATKLGFKAGVKTEIHIARNFHYFETDLLYNYIPQEIKYNDGTNGIRGKRKFGLSMLNLPLTYNMHFFNNGTGNPYFVVRLGLSFSYLLSANIRDEGNAPSYTMNKWEMGPFIGFVYYPFNNTGIFFDMYRGYRQLYKDAYHTEDGQGNLAGFSFGLQQRFPNSF